MIQQMTCICSLNCMDGNQAGKAAFFFEVILMFHPAIYKTHAAKPMHPER